MKHAAEVQRIVQWMGTFPAEQFAEDQRGIVIFLKLVADQLVLVLRIACSPPLSSAVPLLATVMLLRNALETRPCAPRIQFCPPITYAAILLALVMLLRPVRGLLSAPLMHSSPQQLFVGLFPETVKLQLLALATLQHAPATRSSLQRSFAGTPAGIATSLKRALEAPPAAPLMPSGPPHSSAGTPLTCVMPRICALEILQLVRMMHTKWLDLCVDRQ